MNKDASLILRWGIDCTERRWQNGFPQQIQGVDTMTTDNTALQRQKAAAASFLVYFSARSMTRYIEFEKWKENRIVPTLKGFDWQGGERMKDCVISA